MQLRSTIATVLIAFALCAPAVAQGRHTSIHYIRVRTGSPVVLDRFQLTAPPDVTSNLRDNLETCVAFHNTDPRTATVVRIESVYYNANGTRKFSQLFTRNGTFATGAIQGGPTDNSPVNCVRMHLPDADNIAVAYYVDSIDFADGSKWTEEGLMLPDQAIPGSIVPVPLIPKAPASVTAQLQPEVLATFPNCAAAIAAPANAAPAGVLIGVEPGAPIGDGLFHIGAAAVCRASSNPDFDSAALATVQALPEAIVRDAAFRVFVPTIAVAATCQSPARIMHPQLLEPPSNVAVTYPPAGDYVAVAHVDVRPDGYPGKVTIIQSSKRDEFDRALELSATSSRYWPAIVNGTAALGGYDFPMRWLVEDRPGGRISTRSYGPPPVPLPAGCVG